MTNHPNSLDRRGGHRQLCVHEVRLAKHPVLQYLNGVSLLLFSTHSGFCEFYSDLAFPVRLRFVGDMSALIKTRLFLCLLYASTHVPLYAAIFMPASISVIL